MSANNFQTNPSNIDQVLIKGEDLTGAVMEIKYYESILSNTSSATLTLVETGYKPDGIGAVKDKSQLTEIPIRPGLPALIQFIDNQKEKNKLKLKFYVNRIRDFNPSSTTYVYSLDFVPKEFFANEQSRVVSKYEGKISDNVQKILKDKDGLNVKKKLDIDETLRPYNFIGNDRKPFYVCSWLATKSIPASAGSIDGAAGFLLYETYDSFNFKSIDALFKPKKGKKKYIYNDAADLPPGYDAKILTCNVEANADLGKNLALGTYANRGLYFDFYKMDFAIKDYTIDKQKSKIEIASKNILYVDDEFRTPISRLMNHVLDIGVLPSGKDAEEQLKKWKSKPDEPIFDAPNTMVQGIMRYNELFSIKIHVTIAGDFSLRAGDLIECSFPYLKGWNMDKQPDKDSIGIYMIASLCHRVTPTDTFTSLTLVRDSFGKK